MARLYRADGGDLLVEIDDHVLQQLVDALEEEDEEDRDYFIDANTLDYLVEQGVDADVLARLREVVGADGIEVRWER